MESRVTFELLQAARAYRLRSAKLLARVGLYPGQDALLKLLDDLVVDGVRLGQEPKITHAVSRRAWLRACR